MKKYSLLFVALSIIAASCNQKPQKNVNDNTIVEGNDTTIEKDIIKKVEEVKLDKKPDLITSRATFSLGGFLQKTQSIIDKNSLILLYKGSLVQNEIPQGLECECFQRDFRNYLVIKGEKI